MTTLLDMRDSIVAGIAAKLTSLKVCRAYHGALDADEMRKLVTQTPAVLVSLTGGSTVDLQGNQVVGPARWAAFVFTAGAKVEDRTNAAIALVNQLLVLVPDNRWDNADAQVPKNIGFDNLYTSSVDSQASSIWLVKWDQAIDTDPEADWATLEDFLTFKGTYDLVDGVTHTDGDAQDTVNLPAATPPEEPTP